jgi:SAM-dependent methyltransferase
MMSKSLFIDEKHNIYTGQEAAERLKGTIDKEFLKPGQGIPQVSEERWLLAQKYEKEYWTNKSKDSLQDRNTGHRAQFNGYETLCGMKFDNAIEIGCGPFTNLRIIANTPGVAIRVVTLEDPLIETYLKHVHSGYDSNYLYLDYKVYRNFFLKVIRKLTFFLPNNWNIRTTRWLSRKFSKKIKITKLLSRPAEELTFSREKYDLIVMINVIEHCQDIYKIFNNILKLASSEAVFVFSDKYYYHNEVEQRVSEQVFEAGHPLLIDRHLIDGFLHSNFNTLYEKIARDSYTVSNFDFSYDSVYFMGRIKPEVLKLIK